MWLLLAFLSALLLGFYDVFKKQSLNGNAVIPVLFLNTMFSTLIFLPFILLSMFYPSSLEDTVFFVPAPRFTYHVYVILKACIVLGSWIFGYFAMKHLPLTIAGPVNATRPVMVLAGAMIVFGERLNICQWAGVLFAIISFFMLGRSGKKEGIDFRNNRWIFFIVLAAILGATSGLYDKYLMAPPAEGGIGLDRMFVQSWYNVYQFAMMAVVFLVLWYPGRKSTTSFHWDWCIIGISMFLCTADFVYFYALGLGGAMISVVSMVRRSSVIVSFVFGAIVFREKNSRAKFFDLLLLIAGMVFLYLGSK